jgi:hypothetical protein
MAERHGAHTRRSRPRHQRDDLTLTAIFADSMVAGGDNRNWRRRVLLIGLFVASVALGALLLQFGLVGAAAVRDFKRLACRSCAG